jgi:probable HAF family extracellular repeat protein
MVDLNTLLPLNSGWVLMEANDINDNGQITGYGLHNGVGRAFRLSPYKMVNI